MKLGLLFVLCMLFPATFGLRQAPSLPFGCSTLVTDETRRVEYVLCTGVRTVQEALDKRMWWSSQAEIINIDDIDFITEENNVHLPGSILLNSWTLVPTNYDEADIRDISNTVWKSTYSNGTSVILLPAELSKFTMVDHGEVCALFDRYFHSYRGPCSLAHFNVCQFRARNLESRQQNSYMFNDDVNDNTEVQVISLYKWEANNWEDSKQFCTRQLSRLIELRSQEKSDSVKEKCWDYQSKSKELCVFAIGACVKNSLWKWTERPKIMTWSNWHESSGLQNKEHMCAFTGVHGEWHETNKTASNRFPLVACQTKLLPDSIRDGVSCKFEHEHLTCIQMSEETCSYDSIFGEQVRDEYVQMFALLTKGQTLTAAVLKATVDDLCSQYFCNNSTLFTVHDVQSIKDLQVTDSQQSRKLHLLYEGKASVRLVPDTLPLQNVNVIYRVPLNNHVTLQHTTPPDLQKEQEVDEAADKSYIGLTIVAVIISLLTLCGVLMILVAMKVKKKTHPGNNTTIKSRLSELHDYSDDVAVY